MRDFADFEDVVRFSFLLKSLIWLIVAFEMSEDFADFMCRSVKERCGASVFAEFEDSANYADCADFADLADATPKC